MRPIVRFPVHRILVNFHLQLVILSRILCEGFFKKDYYLVSNTIQFNLKTMERISYDDCILVSDIKRDSVQFAMCEETNLEQSYQASREVNVKMQQYYNENQLIVFRAAILLVFIGPHLRGVFSCVPEQCTVYNMFHCSEAQLLMSLPVVCCYGPNNSGKSDRLLVYSACCGVSGGKNKSKDNLYQIIVAYNCFLYYRMR